MGWVTPRFFDRPGQLSLLNCLLLSRQSAVQVSTDLESFASIEFHPKLELQGIKPQS